MGLNSDQIEKITLEEPKEPEIEESEEKLKTLIQEKVEEKRLNFRQ